jgi:hypothetical protein
MQNNYPLNLLKRLILKGFVLINLVFISSCQEDVVLNDQACLKGKIIGGQPCSTIIFVQVLNNNIGEKYTFNGQTYENVIAVNNMPLEEQSKYRNEFYFNLESGKRECTEFFVCPPLVPVITFPLPSTAYCAKNFSTIPCL